MWIGFAEFDYLLGDVHSLKQKRSVVRPIVAEIKQRFSVSVSEVAHRDVHRRTGIGVAVVSGDRAHVVEVLEAIERFAAGRPEVELLSVRSRVIRSDEVD
ncbi:DUF503 domain-containing protein [Gordonia desulfuricans]|uniref:DUF503 domain-containing protein n=1 Tax=Gordonia desulfuricans TaxID=89051 RepID=A0A7K3LL31_9ACTN|nr:MULTISPECIES: DUF503 domain-containing protein [Gordonia]EMP15196.1 hypothetical protein ISGA_698 [Gordonia sp. NB41Y]NDK88969.1 DUF503 domain-containing protein [Gordonia desulfuricans]WLP93270.1 DUF503 domain-containing protein [Gordonia sp. NB41Y]